MQLGNASIRYKSTQLRWTEGMPRRKKLGIYEDGHYIGVFGRAFYVHSGGFESVGRLCIGGDCLEMIWSSNAMIYRAPRKSHECPTRDLSIPEAGRYLRYENTMVPTKVPGLYAFLTLGHKSGKAQHHQPTISEKWSSITTALGIHSSFGKAS